MLYCVYPDTIICFIWEIILVCYVAQFLETNLFGDNHREHETQSFLSIGDCWWYDNDCSYITVVNLTIL